MRRSLGSALTRGRGGQTATSCLSFVRINRSDRPVSAPQLSLLACDSVIGYLSSWIRIFVILTRFPEYFRPNPIDDVK